MDSNSFLLLLREVRSGNPVAVRRWFETYRPVVTQVAAKLLQRRDLQRRIDSSDVAQDVLMSALSHFQAGEFEVVSDKNLVSLLRTMTRNKIIDEARKHQARVGGGETAGRRKTKARGGAEFLIPDPGSSPSRKAARKESIERVRARLSAEMQVVCDLLLAGWEWRTIAAKLDTSEHALQTKFYRHARKVGSGNSGRFDE